MFSIGFTSLSVILFSSIIHLHLLCARFWFYFINIDDVLSINPSAYVLVFGDFNKPILMELINLVNSIIIFLSQMTLPRWLTFLLGPQIDSHSTALLDFFLSSDASICSTMAFPPLGNSDHVVSVSIDFPSNSQQDAPFHSSHSLWLFLCWLVFVIIWEMFHGRI